MQFKLNEEINNYLKLNGVLGLDEDEQLRDICKRVAEIPWGKGRTIEEVLVTKKVGTCTGKHLLLQACFDELGIKYKPVVCTFRWEDQPIRYPDSLQKILKKREWEHGHNFVQVKADGKWVDVDVTWNSRLKPYGFKTFPLDWDGTTSFVGVDKVIKRWDSVDINTKKKEIIDSLSVEVKKMRKMFLDNLILWIKSINS